MYNYERHYLFMVYNYGFLTNECNLKSKKNLASFKPKPNPCPLSQMCNSAKTLFS